MCRLYIISISVLILFSTCEKDTDDACTLKFYGDAYEDAGYSVSILNDGYAIAGQVTEIERIDNNYIESSNKNMCIIKTGWDGNVLWKVSAGGKFDDFGKKIARLPDGSLICVGTFTDTTSAVPSHTDVFAVKISSSGNIDWQRTYGGEGNQTGLDIVKTSEGLMILGTTDVERLPLSDSTGNRKGKTDIFIVSITDNGTFVESFAYGYPGNDIGSVIKNDGSGSYIILGTTDRSEPGQDKNNIIVVKVNSSGYVTESRIIGGVADEQAADLEIISDGYLISGTIGRDGEDQKVFLARLMKNIYAPYPAGFPKEITVDGISTNVRASSSYMTGSFVLAGQSGKGSAANMLIFEIDRDGNPVEDHKLIKGSTGIQAAYDVISGDDGYIIAVGKNMYDVNSMISFLKFRF